MDLLLRANVQPYTYRLEAELRDHAAGRRAAHGRVPEPRHAHPRPQGRTMPRIAAALGLL